MSSGSIASGPLRAQVIGAGPASLAMHLPVLARLRDQSRIVLKSVCDIIPERAAAARARFGFLEDCSSPALDRPDIDVVYIFATAQWHYEYGLRALRNGKHLFVEKPIAPSFALACEMAETAKAHSCVAVGGHNRRFHPALMALQARAGKAGWNFAEAIFDKAEDGRPPSFGARSWLGANGIHSLDALVFTMGGLPRQVTAMADGTHSFCALMRWTNGGQGVFRCNNRAGARREEYIFQAPGETCRILNNSLTIEKEGGISAIPVPAGDDGIAREHDAFLLAIQSGGEPEHALARLAPSLFLAEHIEEGFSGTLALPAAKPLRVVQARQPESPSVLLVAPEGLQGALGRRASGFRLVSLEDVARVASPRPDIVGAILGRNATRLPADILERLPNLAVVGFAGLSFMRLEPEVLLARGITLVHASTAYAESVAEFALGLAILGRRRAFLSHDIMRAGGWGADPAKRGLKGTLWQVARRLRRPLKTAGVESFFLKAWHRAKPLLVTTNVGQPRDLMGATVGLIGWSANARALAARLTQAGARVLIWSDHAAQGDTGSFERVSLGEALAADVVSLHRGLTPATRHFLGAAELERLRPGAVLINIARGALIEPDALFDRLARGDIIACLDTYEDEPLAASHRLRKLPNAFLTSHIAGGSPDMHAAVAEEAVGKVADYLSGGVVEAVSATRLRTMT